METRDDPAPVTVLRWYLEAGVDETHGEVAIRRFGSVAGANPVAEGKEAFAKQQRERGPKLQTDPAQAAISPELAVDPAVGEAVALADAATTLEELRQALTAFDGCTLRNTATRMVFCRGNPQARVVLIGEAPGAEEDRQGLPFVGPSGQLLDRMLASAGLTADLVLISNTVFWRPPGNRSPTQAETAACQPFVQRLIEIVTPDILIALGGPAAHALLGRAESVSRLRGGWYSYQTPRMARPAQATVTFHPAYLLRSPAQKRLAWRDMLAVRHALDTA
jgi:DNA polymerase